MSDPAEPAALAIARLVPAITGALDALEDAARHLDLASLSSLARRVAARREPLSAALLASRALSWPERLQPLRECLEAAGAEALQAVIGLEAAEEEPDPLRAARRAWRSAARSSEALYPLAGFLGLVSRHFIEPAQRDDPAVKARLGSARPGRDGVGTMHLGGPPGTRGGASLYVPEYLDEADAAPLIVALHGGSGNGAAFLWSWLRTARTRGAILLAPTAIGDTWSLTEPQVDGPRIARLIAELGQRWRVDGQKILLTGMSDGGTFTYSWGLGDACPATHLAPVAAGYHPILMGFADPPRLRSLPVRIVHGARDWMFAVATARDAERTLRAAGAAVTYCEIADLAHCYPREENGAILDWFLGKG
ncbi:MAG TPA: hypothetical protein VD970_02570 [Acetobacteraceae bacterium]|nr:hypothetical protein [Acetobacteraceae bacterium]